MCKQALDIYDIRPSSMRAYLGNYGWHFSEELCKYAVSLMRYKEGDKEKSVDYVPKEKIEELLTKHGVKPAEGVNYDFVYTYHMFLSDTKGKVPLDDKTLLLLVKATVEDDDAADGFILRRWYATMVGNGVPVYWSDYLHDS